MDEPTSSLERNDVKHLFSLIRRLAADGIGIIYISHFLEEVREIADGFTVLRDGKSITSGNINEVTDGYLISQIVGRSVDNLYPKRAAFSGASETLLEVQNLSARPELQDATFRLKRGEILGIAGLIGAGRTKMVRAIFGIEKPSSGTITVKGKISNASGGKPALRLLQGLGYLSEDRKEEGLSLQLSIADNITMTEFGRCSRMGWLDLNKQRMQTKELMGELSIRAPSATQAVQTLSGGNQQKVALARLMYQNADIFLLDEPTRGIDIGSKSTIYEIIANLAFHGKAILIVSSYLPELFGLCDRIAVMSRGKLRTARPVSEWSPELVLEAAISSENELSHSQ
jgi:ribose transport system ATP-binding protein